MWSDKLKMVMWIELTSPWEENMTTWYFEKHDRYRNIVNAARATVGKWSHCVLKPELEDTSMTNGTIWRELFRNWISK